MPTDNHNTSKWPGVLQRPAAVFLLLWLVVFVLYLPAAEAGLVGDFPGWVKNVSTMNFWDYVNRTESHIPSLYQFTQMVTWLFYQVFGTHAWPWHLLHVTLQAVNGCLLFILFRNIFFHSGISSGNAVALGGSILFCVCPHISEVVVWEPSFHYLQGLLLILLVLLCVQRYMRGGQAKFAWIAGGLFFLSTWSLEIFYLTPMLTLTLCTYYRFAAGADRLIFRKAILWFFLPQVLLFAVHLFLVNLIYHSGIGHIGTNTLQFSADNLSKPIKYIFHILFFGRYFHDDLRQKVYHLAETPLVLASFYFIVFLIITVLAVKFWKLPTKARAVSLLFVWVIFSIALISLIWFPTTFVVIYDRYTYVSDAFIYMLVALLLSFIPARIAAVSLWGAYTMANVYFTHKVNKLWKVSGEIVTHLVRTFPNDPSKTVLVLNVPECYYGVQMIGSREEGEFKIMYNALMRPRAENPIYEVSAYNIGSPGDGAHVNVVNDSMLHVTLNQWGTWWWWFGFGAINYENEYYKLNMVDEGHWYELTLKKPASEYKLLYVVGDQWKAVDMTKKNVDQN